MKGIEQIIEEHLEDGLRLVMSEDAEFEEGRTVEQIASIPQSPTVMENVLIIGFLVFWIALHIPILPIIIWPNLYRLYLRVFFKIPFVPFICPGPCKSIDLINNRIRIEIRPNDHMPPHFHVVIDDESGAFRIDNCEQLNGDISNKDIKSIHRWYETYKKTLEVEWNLTRPSNMKHTRISK